MSENSFTDEELNDFMNVLDDFMSNNPDSNPGDSHTTLSSDKYEESPLTDLTPSEDSNGTNISSSDEKMNEDSVNKVEEVTELNNPESPNQGPKFDVCGCNEENCEDCKVDQFGINRGWDQARRDKERSYAQVQKDYQTRIDAVFEVLLDICYGCKAGESDFSPSHDHMPKIMFIDPANRTTLEEYEEMFGLNQD